LFTGTTEQKNEEEEEEIAKSVLGEIDKFRMWLFAWMCDCFLGRLEDLEGFRQQQKNKLKMKSFRKSRNKNRIGAVILRKRKATKYEQKSLA